MTTNFILFSKKTISRNEIKLYWNDVELIELYSVARVPLKYYESSGGVGGEQNYRYKIHLKSGKHYYLKYHFGNNFLNKLKYKCRYNHVKFIEYK